MADPTQPTPEPDDVDDEEYAEDVESDDTDLDMEPDDPAIVPPDEVDLPDPTLRNPEAI